MTTSHEPPADRPVPLYVPTLTEALPAPPPATAAGAPPAASPTPVSDAAVQTLLQNLGPMLEPALTEAIARVLHEQLLGFGSRVQKAVAEVTRDTVRQALAQGLHQNPPQKTDDAA